MAALDLVRTRVAWCESADVGIFLALHAEWFNYERKRDRARREGGAARVNPGEYRQFVAKQKRGVKK